MPFLSKAKFSEKSSIVFIFANLFNVWLNKRLLILLSVLYSFSFLISHLVKTLKSPLYTLYRMRTKTQSLNIIIKVIFNLAVAQKKVMEIPGNH